MGSETFDLELESEKLRRRTVLLFDAAELFAAVLPRQPAEELLDAVERFVWSVSRAAMDDSRNFEQACRETEDTTLWLHAERNAHAERVARQLNTFDGTAH